MVATAWLLLSALLYPGAARGQCAAEPDPCTPSVCCFDRWNTVIDATTSCDLAANNYSLYLTGNSDNYFLSEISLENTAVCIGNNDIDIDASVMVNDKTQFYSQGQFGLTVSLNGFVIFDFTNNGQGGPNTDGSLALLNNYLAANCAGGCTLLQAAVSALPVTLESWTVRTEARGVILEWVTSSEKDNDYFLIERSTDGRTFREVGRRAGQGTAEGVATYRFADEAPRPGRNYYRLTQFDFDGSFESFGLRSADWVGAGTVTVRPNPVRAGAELWVEVPESAAGAAGGLYGLDGRRWATLPFAAGQRTAIRLPATLPAGVYLLRIDGTSHRIVVQR
jgi:hypothetical protein